MKPESRFITSVNDKVPKTVHREKMHNIYRGGTFDVWYSGSKADLWVEYKWIPRTPKRGRVVPDLSELQLRWGRGRAAEGRSVLVVVGCPEGAVMLRPNQWEAGVSVEEFWRTLMTKPALAAWITSLTAGEQNDAVGSTATRHSTGNKRPVQDSGGRSSDIRTTAVSGQAPAYCGLGLGGGN